MGTQEHKLEKKTLAELGIKIRQGYEWWRPRGSRVGWIFKEGLRVEGMEEELGKRIAWIKWKNREGSVVMLGVVWPSWDWNQRTKRAEANQWWGKTERQVNRLKEEGTVLIVGDWNARTEERLGPNGEPRGVINHNGKRLIELMENQGRMAVNASNECQGQGKWHGKKGGKV